jgi:hypothetical protein
VTALDGGNAVVDGQLRLGYRDRTGMGLGLLFGLATIAWPYAKQFFGEPLSALAC